MEDNELVAEVQDYLTREKAYYDQLWEGAEFLTDDNVRDPSLVWKVKSMGTSGYDGIDITDIVKADVAMDRVARTPQWMAEEWKAAQQKAASTSVDFGAAVHVVYDDRSNRVGISTPRGFAEITRSQCAGIGQLLISLAAPESPSSPGAPTHSPGADIPKERRPNHPGYKSPADRNQERLDYALEQERLRQKAIIQKNQLDAAQRRSRW